MDPVRPEFPSTRWSSVLAARDRQDRTLHLDHLFRAYWSPVYAFIRRGWASNDDDARDLTQGFFLRLLETDFLRDVSPERGRFRTYLKACLRNSLLDAKKAAAAAKRGGDRRLFSLEGVDLPATGTEASPDRAFDDEWVHALLRTAVPDLRRSLEAADRAVTWEVFRRLDVDSTPDHRPTYAALAAELGIPEQQVKSHADFARKAMREAVLARIREYADGEAEAVQELRELFR